MPSAAAATPEVTQVFADLDLARAELRRADDDCRAQRRALRRFAHSHGLGLKQARRQLRLTLPDNATALQGAELAYDRALSEFRRVALIAALTRIVATDRRLRAA